MINPGYNTPSEVAKSNSALSIIRMKLALFLLAFLIACHRVSVLILEVSVLIKSITGA